MAGAPGRIFLDTNIYIIGSAVTDSPEAIILDWAGFAKPELPPVEVVFSDVLKEQILRVARRLRGKDWGGEIISRIWQGMKVRYVLLDLNDIERMVQGEKIPREDIEIYLTARIGEAGCFVSANRELVQALAMQKGSFECLEPEAFVAKYLSP